MFILYADESGDIGLVNSPSAFFVLSGLVMHELEWKSVLEQVVEFRRHLRQRYGLKLREEIHAAHMLQKPGELARIPKHLRLRLIRDVADFQARLNNISVVNIVVAKAGKAPTYDVFDKAWTCLIQRFHNTIRHRNFPGAHNQRDLGLLIVDRTDERKLRNLTRQMRHYNPVPNMAQFGAGYRQIPLDLVVEDPNHRDSKHSLLVQLADVNAFLLYQSYAPNAFIRKQGARNYFQRLEPVLCKVASPRHPLGIVEL